MHSHLIYILMLIMGTFDSAALLQRHLIFVSCFTVLISPAPPSHPSGPAFHCRGLEVRSWRGPVEHRGEALLLVGLRAAATWSRALYHHPEQRGNTNLFWAGWSLFKVLEYLYKEQGCPGHICLSVNKIQIVLE